MSWRMLLSIDGLKSTEPRSVFRQFSVARRLSHNHRKSIDHMIDCVRKYYRLSNDDGTLCDWSYRTSRGYVVLYRLNLFMFHLYSWIHSIEVEYMHAEVMAWMWSGGKALFRLHCTKVFPFSLHFCLCTRSLLILMSHHESMSMLVRVHFECQSITICCMPKVDQKIKVYVTRIYHYLCIRCRKAWRI